MAAAHALSFALRNQGLSACVEKDVFCANSASEEGCRLDQPLNLRLFISSRFQFSWLIQPTPFGDDGSAIAAGDCSDRPALTVGPDGPVTSSYVEPAAQDVHQNGVWERSTGNLV